MLEEFSGKAENLIIEYDQLMVALRRQDVAADIESAQLMLREHSRLRENIEIAEVDSLVQMAQVILERLDYSRNLAGRNAISE